MSARLHPSAFTGRRVIVETIAGTLYGSAGTLTLSSTDRDTLVLSGPKGRDSIRLPAAVVKTVTPIRCA